MVLTAFAAAVVVGAAIWAPFRRLIFVLAAIGAAAYLVTLIPSHNVTLKSYRLVFNLISHIALHSVHKTIAADIRMGRRLIARHL